MMPGELISGQLSRGLAFIGLIGGLLLVAFVGLDVEMMLTQASARLGWNGNWLEIAEHVALPVALMLIPGYLAARRLVRRSFVPLAIATERIEALQGSERGFRLDVSDIPQEVVPFFDAVNHLLDRLDLALAQREAFAASSAHELRHPLSVIILELDSIADPKANAIKREVLELSRLLTQLLVIAHFEADALVPLPRTRVDLARIARIVVRSWKPAATAADKHLKAQITKCDPVLASPEMLSAALRNLVENALRVTPPGGTVTVSVGPEPHITVRDGGPGLSVSDLARLTKRHQRGANPSSDGAGLGLSIVLQVAVAHGGQLTTDPERREIRLELQGAA